MKCETEPRFFASGEEFRAWLAEFHATEPELWVGFHKRHSKLPSMTWPESVDEALCYGWIDGVRKRIDEQSYKIRFTPRRKRSRWSAVNSRRIAELKQLERVQASGWIVYAERQGATDANYAYEQRHLVQLDETQETEFRNNRKAWRYFEAQPAWYRRTALWWVVSAKREETRARRLAQLIADSAEGKTIRELNRENR